MNELRLQDSSIFKLFPLLHLIHRGNFFNKSHFLFANGFLFAPDQFKIPGSLHTCNKPQFTGNSQQEKFQNYLKAKTNCVIYHYRGIKIYLFCYCLKYFRIFFLLNPTWICVHFFVSRLFFQYYFKFNFLEKALLINHLQTIKKSLKKHD